MYVKPRSAMGCACQHGVGDDTGAVSKVADFVSSPLAKKVGGAVNVYHGYKRTNSIVWALIYGAFGYFAPVTTTAISVAEGFGERKACL